LVTSNHDVALFLVIFVLPAIVAASLNGSQQKFYFYIRLFTWAAFMLLLFTPLFVVCSQALVMPVPNGAWIKAIFWAIAVFLLLLYARKRCGSEKFPYINGLMFVAHSMQLWGMAGTILLAIPALFLIIIASIVMSLFYDLIGKSDATPIQYYKMIGLIYKNRTRQ
jgi:hypothetical protein